MANVNLSTPAKMRRLASLVREEETERARVICDDELKALGLPSDLTATIRRRVTKERSVPGLVARLEALADSLEGLVRPEQVSSTALPVETPPERAFSHMPVRKVGTTEGYFYFLPVKDIVCCVSTTLLPGESIVDAAWRRQVLPSSHIQVLSTKDTWVSRYRSLAEVERRLGPQKFLSTDRSTLVNVDKIRVINMREKPKLIGVEVTQGKIEWFPISRRAMSKVCFFLGLRR